MISNNLTIKDLSDDLFQLTCSYLKNPERKMATLAFPERSYSVISDTYKKMINRLQENIKNGCYASIKAERVQSFVDKCRNFKLEEVDEVWQKSYKRLPFKNKEDNEKINRLNTLQNNYERLIKQKSEVEQKTDKIEQALDEIQQFANKPKSSKQLEAKHKEILREAYLILGLDDIFAVQKKQFNKKFSHFSQSIEHILNEPNLGNVLAAKRYEKGMKVWSHITGRDEIALQPLPVPPFPDIGVSPEVILGLEDDTDFSVINNDLYIAVKEGNLDAVKAIFPFQKYVISKDTGYVTALVYHVYNLIIDVYSYFFPDINSRDLDSVIYAAGKNNKPKVIDLVLQYPAIARSSNQWKSSVEIALEKRYFGVIRSMLKDPKIAQSIPKDSWKRTLKEIGKVIYEMQVANDENIRREEAVKTLEALFDHPDILNDIAAPYQNFWFSTLLPMVVDRKVFDRIIAHENIKEIVRLYIWPSLTAAIAQINSIHNGTYDFKHMIEKIGEPYRVASWFPYASYYNDRIKKNLRSASLVGCARGGNTSSLQTSEVKDIDPDYYWGMALINGASKGLMGVVNLAKKCEAEEGCTILDNISLIDWKDAIEKATERGKVSGILTFLLDHKKTEEITCEMFWTYMLAESITSGYDLFELIRKKVKELQIEFTPGEKVAIVKTAIDEGFLQFTRELKEDGFLSGLSDSQMNYLKATGYKDIQEVLSS